MPPRKAAGSIDAPKPPRAPRKSRAKAVVNGVASPVSEGGVKAKAAVDKKPRKRKAAAASKTDPSFKSNEQSLLDNRDVIHFSMVGAEQLDSDDEGSASMVPMEYEDPNPSSYTEVVDACLEPNTCKDEGNYADDDDPQDKALPRDIELFGDDTDSDDNDDRDNLDETPVVVPLIRLEKKAKSATTAPRFSGVELQLEPDSE